MNDPAVLFYTSDFLIGVMDFNMEDRGKYITLLCYQHQKGHMSLQKMKSLVGEVSEDILSKFTKDSDGNYFNLRMESEQNKRRNFCESRRRNASKKK